MAVDLLGFTKMDEQIAIQEAASDGLRSMEHLIRVLSQQQQQQQQQQKLNPQQPSSHNSVHNLDCREITDFTVSKFKKVNSILNRTGHARFRRGPSPSSSSSSSFQQQQHIEKLSDHQNRNNSTHHSTVNHHQQQPQPVSISPPPHGQTLTLDFTKPNFMTPNPTTHSEVSTSQFTKDSSFSISPPMSSNTSSFLSSITADGSVSNGKQGSSIFVAPAPTISAGKPPLSSSYRKKCHEHGHSDNVSVNYSVSGSRCHCSSKRRKSRVKKTVRVPAISSKMADIPADEHSWRKYGQKPIKGSPYPRGYYKCSTMRGCPARKHVERDQDEPTMLIVTYEGEHRHSQPPSPPVVGESTVHGGGSVGLVMFESS